MSQGKNPPPRGKAIRRGLAQPFVPSRGRDLAAYAAAGVTGRQPTGRALPSLIVGEPHTHTGGACEVACAVSPLATLANAGVPGKANAVISSLARDPAAFRERRRRAILTFREVVAKMEPRRGRWANALPSESPDRKINIPFLHSLVKRNGYVDSSIVDDIAKGMPIAGDIAPTGALRPRVKEAEMTLEE